MVAISHPACDTVGEHLYATARRCAARFSWMRWLEGRPTGRPSSHLIQTLCEAPQALSSQCDRFANGITCGMTRGYLGSIKLRAAVLDTLGSRGSDIQCSCGLRRITRRIHR